MRIPKYHCCISRVVGHADALVLAIAALYRTYLLHVMLVVVAIAICLFDLNEAPTFYSNALKFKTTTLGNTRYE